MIPGIVIAAGITLALGATLIYLFLDSYSWWKVAHE